MVVTHHGADDTTGEHDVGGQCHGLGQGQGPVQHRGRQHHPGDPLLSVPGAQHGAVSEQSDLHHQGSGWNHHIQQILQGTFVIPHIYSLVWSMVIV